MLLGAVIKTGNSLAFLEVNRLLNLLGAPRLGRPPNHHPTRCLFFILSQKFLSVIFFVSAKSIMLSLVLSFHKNQHAVRPEYFSAPKKLSIVFVLINYREKPCVTIIFATPQSIRVTSILSVTQAFLSGCFYAPSTLGNTFKFFRNKKPLYSLL